MTFQLTFEFEETDSGWNVWVGEDASGTVVSGDTPRNALRNYLAQTESDDGLTLTQSDMRMTSDGPILTDEAIERAKRDME